MSAICHQYRSAEIDGAAGRQIALGNSPTLHLSPIEHGCRQFSERRLNVANLFTIEDAKGDLGGLLCLSSNDLHWTTDDPLSEKGLIVKKDRCVGYAKKA
jgi:hypothetical protein